MVKPDILRIQNIPPIIYRKNQKKNFQLMNQLKLTYKDRKTQNTL